MYYEKNNWSFGPWFHYWNISQSDTASGGTFSTYLGILRRNGLVQVEGQRVTASDVLWPEAAGAI